MVELILNKNYVELQPQELGIRITKAVNDISNPSRRQGSYSNTITIPKTKNNDKIFQHIYNLQSVSDIVNKKNEAILKNNGTVVMKGFLKVEKIYTDGYECTVYADNADWFAKLENIELKDCINDNFPYSANNIFDSWNKNSNTANIFFPYLQINGSLEESMLIKNWIPFFYVRYLLKSIFGTIGYMLNDTFFNKPIISELALSGSQEKLKAPTAWKNLHVATATGIGQHTYTYPSPGVYTTLPFINPYFYQITNANIDWTFGGNNDYYYPQETGKYKATVYTQVEHDVNIGVQTNNYRLDETLNVVVGSTLLNEKIATAEQIIYKSYPGVQTPSDILYTKFTVSFEFEATQGDALAFYIERNIRSTEDNSSDIHICNMTLIDCVITITPLDVELPFGELLPLKEAAPDIKPKDFISSLANTFNLVMEEKDGEVLMLPQDEYYLSPQDAEDWTDKVSVDEDYTITPLSTMFGKNFLFKHKQADLGSWNSTSAIKEKLEFIKYYGDNVEFNPNENATEDTTIAQTNFYTPKTTLYNEVQNGFQWALENTNIKRNFGSYYPYLVFKGLVKEGAIQYKQNVNGSAINRFSYLHVFTSKNQQSDGSLLFANKSDYGFGYIVAGLTELYYSNTLRRMKEGSMIECSVKLNDSDIEALSFRKPKIIQTPQGKILVILNKVKEYEVGENQLTKCEFITY
jgi:hypothetical protein